MRHANGATNLIQLRGPETYNTEFEKALFMAHSGPIVSMSYLCFKSGKRSVGGAFVDRCADDGIVT